MYVSLDVVSGAQPKPKGTAMAHEQGRRSTALGTVHEIDLPTARVRYFEAGQGPPVVFVHGLLVNAELWRAVVPGVAAAGFRCLAPDWPLGAHRIPVPAADLTPPGVAGLVADFLDRLDLQDVTIVANDTGGAITQLLMVNHPERIGRVVLTPSDCFHRFFPWVFAPLPVIARIPGGVWLLAQLLRIRALHRLPMTFGWVSKRPVPRPAVDSYLQPSRQDRLVRQDLSRFLRGVHRRHTLAAAQRLPGFDRPVLLAWASEDRLFPIALAHRLAELLPDAKVVPIDDSYTFVPEDQPTELARLITEFTRAAA
jgi:pimeloyl-ACP methyl ester carboxylesterase